MLGSTGKHTIGMEIEDTVHVSQLSQNLSHAGKCINGQTGVKLLVSFTVRQGVGYPNKSVTHC